MIINMKVKKETAFIKIELFMSAVNNVIVIESSNNVTIYLIASLLLIYLKSKIKQAHNKITYK